MPSLHRWLALLVLAIVLAGDSARAQGLADLRVGHWVEVKGTLEGESIVASSIEALPPSDKHVLIGTVTEVDEADKFFVILGQYVQVSEKTQWKDVSLSDEKTARRQSSVKAERRADMMEQILDTAEFLFSRNGLHGVTLKDVAKRIGVHHTLINYYFDDWIRSSIYIM